MTAAYDTIGRGYSLRRRSDPRWQSAVDAALAGARSVLNVGAGTGSYEPHRQTTLAVEPSAEMIRQRPAHSAPAMRAGAEALPVATNAVDAALAVLTVHHWSHWRRGVAELRRVAGLRVVLAYEPRLHADYWFVREYLPELAERELARPSVDAIAAELGATSVTTLPLAADFTDGVFPAYWQRPEAYLQPEVQRACSALAQTPAPLLARATDRLRADLASGAWHDRHHDLLLRQDYDAGFRLIVADDR